MSGKPLAALVVLAGLGISTQAHAQTFRPGRPIPPGAPIFAPAPAANPGAFCGAPLPPRDLERHIVRTLRQHYGHCIDDIDVNVDRRRNCIDVELEVRRPIPQWQATQLLHAMPELRGYHVHLQLERD